MPLSLFFLAEECVLQAFWSVAHSSALCTLPFLNKINIHTLLVSNLTNTVSKAIFSVSDRKAIFSRGLSGVAVRVLTFNL